MEKQTFTPEFKAQVLKEVQQVKNVALVARKHNIPSRHIYYWVKADKKTSKAPYLSENKTLKKELADTKLELLILKDLLKKTYKP